MRSSSNSAASFPAAPGGPWLSRGVAGLVVGVHAVTSAWAVATGREDLLHAAVLTRAPSLRVLVGGQLADRIPTEPWRLCTSVLLHTSLVHLLLNASALLALGTILEPLLGRVRWASVFVVGGLFGSIVPHLAGVRQSDGASGAAFALLGAGLSLRWREGPRLDPEDRWMLGPVFLGFTAVNLALGFVIPGVDVTAHVGGLLAGLLVGLLPRTRGVEAVEALVVGAFVGVCAFGWS